jgi:F-type H+-transporting ATPase subunit gamma
MAGKSRELRRRIGAVRNTQKTTRAMKTVSMAKLARASLAVQAARPYAQRMRALLAAVAAGAEPDAHPLLVPRERVRRLDVVVLTSDRGLCGAFNANVIKRADALVAKRRPELDAVAVIPIGRKGADHFRRHPVGDVPRVWTGVRSVTPEVGREIAEFLAGRYASGAADEAVIVFSEFVSALTQHAGEEQLLPVRPDPAAAAVRYEIEPSPAALLERLVPRAVEFAVFRALLENQAGEHGARMTAMDNATNNTSDLIRRLTLDYNKARQAAITAELVEIVSASEST